jgi:hypothetical protein
MVLFFLTLAIVTTKVAAVWSDTESSLGVWDETRIFPPGRSKHVAVSIGNDKIYVSGGLGDGGILWPRPGKPK